MVVGEWLGLFARLTERVPFPIAMLASISAAARQGILIKGVKYVERLPQPTCCWSIRLARCRRADPQMTDVIPFNGLSSDELLQLTGAFKRHSDHLLAEAGRSAAAERRLPLATAATFEVIPGGKASAPASMGRP